MVRSFEELGIGKPQAQKIFYFNENILDLFGPLQKPTGFSQIPLLYDQKTLFSFGLLINLLFMLILFGAVNLLFVAVLNYFASRKDGFQAIYCIIKYNMF
jgi:hypothetical protein